MTTSTYPPAFSRAALAAVILLLAFPQLSETIYAPVLPHIASSYGVTDGQAQWTMSIYFAAFAAGVLFWGRLADLRGRRPALLAGLVCYGAAAVLALLARDFSALLLARALLAFGASVGSVVIQTMLRDRYRGPQLAAVFSTVVFVLALSPAIGPLLGTMLAARYGHFGVFVCLALLSLVLLCCGAGLPETRPPQHAAPAPLLPVARRMLGDGGLWAAAWLVAGFNLILFGYYTLAPFTLAQLGMPHWVFGASGLLIAAASAVGARLNLRGLRRLAPARMVQLAAYASLAAAALQWTAMGCATRLPLAAVIALLGTQAVLTLGYACAIPNIMAGALEHYRAVQGSAGALFGLSYYVLIAAGLAALGACYAAQPMAQPIFMLIVSAALLPAACYLSRQAQSDAAAAA